MWIQKNVRDGREFRLFVWRCVHFHLSGAAHEVVPKRKELLLRCSGFHTQVGEDELLDQEVMGYDDDTD